MGVVYYKAGVSFDVIAPAGFRILGALDQFAKQFFDLWITSACDGAHSGPMDPHKLGKAFDVRTHGFSQGQKYQLISEVMRVLGWEHFYGFLEAAGTANEHAHFQQAKGTVFP